MITEQRRAAAVHWKEADRIWKTVIEICQHYNRTRSPAALDQWEAAVADYKAKCNLAKAADPFWQETACEEYPND